MTIRYDIINNAAGVVSVRNQQANLTLDPVEYAFLGNSTVRIKIRQDSIAGPVVLESQPITIVDIAELISVTANTYSVPEGQDVLFTILTRNAPDGAFIAYVAESVTGNITANDLSIGNVSALAGGFSEIIDNIATFIVFANVDSVLGETGESFKISARAGNTNGLILGYSDNVTIKDSVEFFSITSSNSTVDFNTNVTFTIQTFGLPDGANLFYFTAGDVINFDSANAQANTGYVITSSNVATVTLRPIAPTNSISPFNLLIRDANTNALLASSSGVNSIGEDTRFTNITGGTETTIGNYKYHVYTTSGVFTIDRVGEINSELQIFAVGAGQPGGTTNYDGGGGGEVINTSYNIPRSIQSNQGSVIVAQTSPTSTGSSSTQILFGAGGTSIVARSATYGVSGNGNPVGPRRIADVDGGGGGGGAGGAGVPGAFIFSSPNFYRAGEGGAAQLVPWLSENNVGSSLMGPLGAPGRFGGGGGGGGGPGNSHWISGFGAAGSGGAGGGQIRELRSHYYFDGNFTYIQSYTYFNKYGGSPAVSYGGGGGGAAVGGTTTPGPGGQPAPSFTINYGFVPGGAGAPGAVIMRYRIAED